MVRAMRYTRRIIRLAIFLALLIALLGSLSTRPVRGAEPDVSSIIAGMTVDQKVGQIVMAGFPGYGIGPEVTQLIKEHHIGGVILFARNVRDPLQVSSMTYALQQMAQTTGPGIPLFVAADQEGGIVVRFREGTTLLPGAMALGATGSEKYATELGRITAQELKAIGVNMNFAPVLDVNNNPANPVIGLRSLGEDPDAVARLGASFIRGHQSEGVLATAKHFPGHGDTHTDSHIALPTISHSRARLDAVELVPFRAAIDAGIDAIMSAHITFPAVDPTPGLPATLSHRVLTGLLRDELGFEGLIVTDAMEMQAITSYFGLQEGAIRAFEAGADIILVAWPSDWYDAVRVINALLGAVRSGRISEDRLNASVERILRFKAARGLFTLDARDGGRVAAHVGGPDSTAFARQVARDAITVVKDDTGILPLNPATAGRVLVVVPQLSDLTQAEERGTSRSTLGNVIKQRIPSAGEVVVGTNPGATERLQVLRAARQVDTVIVGTYRATAANQQATLVEELRRLNKRLIVVALREPYDLTRFPNVSTYVATYGYLPVHMTALGDVLFGEWPARGRLPVTLPGLYPIGHGLSLGEDM